MSTNSIRSALVAAGLAVTMIGSVSQALAAPQSAKANLSSDHEISANWGSSVAATGTGEIQFDRETGKIDMLRIKVDGIKVDELAPAGPNGVLGAIHIHNYPQGGPKFFVQHLPAELTATETGFVFELSDWVVEAPKVKPGLTADFVLSEIENGNAYFGVHSVHDACPKNKKDGVAGTCAAPGTAISGHLTIVE